MRKLIIGAIIAIVFGATLAMRESPTRVLEEGSRWQYLQNWEAFDKRKGRNGAVLDSLGSQGWELVQIISETGPMGSGFWHGVFKRKVVAQN